jgi:hypothetical protein
MKNKFYKMKSMLNKLKKGFGLVSEEPPTGEPSSSLPVTPVKRDAIISFIVQSLKPYVDERTVSIAGIHLYILCNDAEQEEAALVALCADKPGMFRSHYLERKLVNHFIQLEANWFFEYELVREQLPENSLQQGNFGVKVVRAHERVMEHYTIGCLQVLVGQADKQEYVLDPKQQLKFYIGRSKSPQLSSGKIQMNDIVFLGKDEPGFDELAGRANLHVSRNHAYIEYDPRTGQYFIFPDKGGLPDNGNKIKVHTVDVNIKWLNIYGVAHALEEGDQVELGGEAVLRFKYL